MFLLSFAAQAAPPLRVASLSEHNPVAWKGNESCLASASVRISCNLRLYEQAALEASEQNASLLLLPEAYGLSGSPSKHDFFEPWISAEGISNPCVTGDRTLHPQQVALSCAAATNHLAVAANIFIAIPEDGSRVIRSVVYNASGALIANYTKHHLFPTEVGIFTPGPFNPTSFDLYGRRIGIVVCYEGLYPSLTGDWSQMDELKRQGAGTFIWPVGGWIDLKLAGKKIATKYSVAIVGSEDSTVAAILGPDGQPMPSQQVSITTAGYTEGRAALLLATL